MILKNTLKLSFVNSSNIWKILLYRVLCILCILGLTTVVAWPIINILIKDNFFVNLQNSFEQMIFNLNFEKLFLTIDNVFKNFASIISAHNLTVQTIACGIVLFFIISMAETYESVAVHHNVGGYMSSLTKYGFTNSYVSYFGKSTLLGFVRVITVLPVNLIIWLGSYFFASTLYAHIGVLAVILALFLLITLLSLKLTFFSGWIPALIICDESILSSLKKGVLAVGKRFFKTLSNFLVLILALFIINVFGMVFTAGVGLLIIMPLTSLLVVIMNEVTYFEALGMRYYVDSEHIISPKKLEQQDSFEKVKDII